MPPEASQRLTASRSFDRLEGETTKAYEAFVTYRNLGPKRTIPATVEALNRPEGYARMLYEWSSDWNWGERAEHFDAIINLRAREIVEEHIPLWESRRQVALERMMMFSAKLMNRAEAMLDHPLTKEVTRESADGRTIYNIIEPSKWNWGSLATIIRTAVEIQTAAISEALVLSEDESFDVESATADELKAFIARSKRKPTIGV